MSVLFLDFESYYDDEYSLRQMTPPEYVLDPRWETIGCAAAVDNEPSHWVDGPDFEQYIRQFDPAKTTTVTFNALFDNCVLAWRYGFVPARMLCSMRMAAALRGHILTGLSLAKVLSTLGLGEKGDTIKAVKGMRRSEIMNDPGLWRAFQAYANNDNEGSRAVFTTLAPEFPAVERKVMDRVLRCAVEPAFKIDVSMLAAHLSDLDTARTEALIEAGAKTSMEDPHRDEKVEEFATTLRSNSQFQAILEAQGIEVSMKSSTTDPSRMIPAFAKTDEFMANLLEHEDPVIQNLASARLGLRSTIERSRGDKMLRIASLPWPSYCAGNMPIPLRYSGAHTHRLSGEWKINMQNLPAGRGGNKSKLRKSLVAPPGHKVLVADFSQIECRISAWLVGEIDLLDQFANKKDPYSILASKIFGYPVDRKAKVNGVAVQELEGFIGKSGVLGLGFGCGAAKFFAMVVRSARGMKMDMAKLMAVWNQNLAQKSVYTYRNANPRHRDAWGQLDAILDTSWCGATTPQKWGPGGVVEIGHGYVLLPSGMKLVYNVQPKGEDGHRYKYGRFYHKMYGCKFLENIVQALARIVAMNAALRLWDRGLKFKLQSHDELVFIVPDAEVEEAKRIVLEEMRKRPGWGRDIPLDAEANYGPSYGDAK